MQLERSVEDSRRFFEKLCDFDSTSSSLPADMSSSCLFTLPAEDLITETLGALAAMGKTLEERVQMEKTDPSLLGYAFWLVVGGTSAAVPLFLWSLWIPAAGALSSLPSPPKAVLGQGCVSGTPGSTDMMFPVINNRRRIRIQA